MRGTREGTIHERRLLAAEPERVHKATRADRSFVAQALATRAAADLLRVAVAWEHFIAASAMVEKAPKTARTAARVGLLLATAVDLKVLEGKASPDLLAKLEEVRPAPANDLASTFAFQAMDAATGRLLLALGLVDEAEAHYRGLLRERGVPGQCGIWRLGLAQVRIARGEDPGEELDLAGLEAFTAGDGSRLLAARTASGLVSAHGRIGRPRGAQRWADFLVRLGLPRETLAAIVARTAIGVERSKGFDYSIPF